jgi:hypothetical protein
MPMLEIRIYPKDSKFLYPLYKEGLSIRVLLIDKKEIPHRYESFRP